MTRLPAVFGSICVLAFASVAAAQTTSATTGAMNGTVTDNTKAVLPGVTVTISSSSMMGTRSDITNEQGQYRFAAVTPGEYKMTFELQGFANVVHENVRVTLGFTATVNVEMELASQRETITVVGSSPVVDTSATKVTTNYDAQQMANLPNARDYAGLMSTTPAVKVNRIDVGGSTSLSEQSYRVYGIPNQQDRPLVEGMLASEGTSLLYYTDYGSFAEVSVGAAGNSAEMPGSGVFSQFIAKSGGNTYHGNFYQDYYGKNWSTQNIDDAQLALGVTGGPGLDARDTNRTTSYHDTNGDIGGYLMRDRMWWYGSLRKIVNEVAKPNFPVHPQHTQVVNRTAKVTYQINTNNKLTGFVNHNSKSQPDRLTATNIYLDDLSTWNQIGFPVGVWKGEWNSILNQAAFLEVRAGKYFYNWQNRGKSQDTRVEDLNSAIVRGSDRYFDNIRSRPQFWGALSYFKSGWAGTHNFKFGGEMMDETFEDVQGGYPGNVLVYTRNSVPYHVRLYSQPNTSINGLGTTSIYAQDTWQVSRVWTLTPGIRFDRYQNYLPAQTHSATTFDPVETKFPEVDDLAHFYNWGPRLGVTYNVGGSGKTVIKGNFGLYRNSPGPSLFNPNPSLWYKEYNWVDRNNDGIFQVGEHDGAPTNSAGGITNEIVDPNLRMGVMTEGAGFLERELMPNFGIRTGVVIRHLETPKARYNSYRPLSAYNVPVSVQDPGPDGRVGTADDGGSFTAFNLDATALARGILNQTTSLNDISSDYTTWEVTATKRMARRWSLLATFAHTWARDSVWIATAVNGNYSPNDTINAGEGDREHYTNWQGKLLGTLELNHDIRISPVLRAEAGAPWARTFTQSMNYGTQTFFAEPFGSRRLPNIVIFDVRGEKGVRFKGHRVSGFIDVFNMFNANPPYTIIQTSGASFMRPTVITSPRVARVGFKFEW
jgi:Carboxypeptidase regulatory-like domain